MCVKLEKRSDAGISCRKGEKMKKKVFFCLACVALICTAIPAFAAPTVTITAPELTFTTSTGNASLNTALSNLFGSTTNTLLQTELDKLEATTQEELDKYGSQDDLAKGFGNANSYAGQSATLQGYQGYKLFSVSTGAMVGLQLPTSDFSTLGNSLDNFEEDPDVYLGIAPSMSILNIGINAEKVFGLFVPSLGEKLNNFYFNLKFGGIGYDYSYKQDTTTVGIDMKSSTFGIGVNYQILPSFPSLAFGLFKWRGVSLGSGFTVQKNKITMTPTIDPIRQSFSQSITYDAGSIPTNADVTATLACYPSMKLELDMSTFTIPLEATTSAQILWLLNVNIGAGVDLVFGKSDVNAVATGALKIENVDIDTDSGTITSTGKDGSVAIDASTKGKPSFLHPRLMTGLGMNFGPVKIDIPVYFYPGSGYAFGVTAAFVW
jgi:hypothetical protein